MVSTNLPPTQKKQEWLTIIFVFFLVLIASSLLFIHLSWGLQNQLPKLQSFKDLFVAFLKNCWQLVIYHEPSSILRYWRYVQAYGAESIFIIYGVLPIIPATILAFLAAKVCYVPGGISRVRQVSGPRLLEGNTAISHAKKRSCNKRSKSGLSLHPKVTLSKIQEQGNIFLLGNMGSGKTSLQLGLYEQVLSRNVPAFIFDYKKEFTAYFYNQDKTILVAVNDQRSTPWEISEDVTTKQEAINISSQLILSNEKDPFWTDGCKMILAGLMISLIKTKEPWGWKKLAELVELPIDDMKKVLRKDFPMASDFISDAESKMSQSFKASLISQLHWIISLGEYWPESNLKGFSVKQWIRKSSKQQPIFIVQHDVQFADVTGPLVNALIGLMYVELISLQNDTNREVWLLIDELGHLPRNDTLESWLAVGRSKGCRSIVATQTYSKLLNIYGKDLCHSILDLFEILYVLRLSGSDSADYVIKRFGKKRIERPTSSSGPNGQPVQNWHGEEVNLIDIGDLIHLPKPDPNKKYPITSYLMLQGWNAVYKLTFPFSDLKPIQSESIPNDIKKVVTNNSKSEAKDNLLEGLVK